MPNGENAFLYWDPETRMQNIHNSLEVGVTYLSNDIKPVKVENGYRAWYALPSQPSERTMPAAGDPADRHGDLLGL